jgi:hypothetical protein
MTTDDTITLADLSADADARYLLATGAAQFTLLDDDGQPIALLTPLAPDAEDGDDGDNADWSAVDAGSAPEDD